MPLLHPSRRDFLAMSAAALAARSAAPAFAQAWPSRPVTMVVPYGPGASNDIFTRALSQILSARLGQPFVVENCAGAGGFTGSNAVAQSAPDGYTFLEAPNSIASFSLIMKVKLDPLTDLMPVALLARSPIGMVINAALPAKTVQGVHRLRQGPPDLLRPCRHRHDAAPACRDVQAGDRPDDEERQLQELRRGADRSRRRPPAADVRHGRQHDRPDPERQLRLLAYTDKNYPPGGLEAPTMAEAGVPRMEKAQSWWGIFAPPRLPAEIRDRMNAAINEAIREPEFTALLAKSGASAAPASPAEFTEVVVRRSPRWRTSSGLWDCSSATPRGPRWGEPGFAPFRPRTKWIKSWTKFGHVHETPRCACVPLCRLGGRTRQRHAGALGDAPGRHAVRRASRTARTSRRSTPNSSADSTPAPPIGSRSTARNWIAPGSTALMLPCSATSCVPSMQTGR